MKKVLSIAGSDCSGGAGIQADLKTFSAHGVFGMSVIVSVVAENTSRVIDIQDITPDMIEKQIDAVFEDIEVDAVKIGMLSTPECMKAVAKKLLQYKPQNVVIDPVMYEAEILLHQTAKNHFDELGIKKLPSVKSLREEYTDLLEQKRKVLFILLWNLQKKWKRLLHSAHAPVSSIE